MAVTFNNKVFEEFKLLSVQKSDELELGETYFMFHIESVVEGTLVELRTEKEECAKRGMVATGPDADRLAWFVLLVGDDNVTRSSRDTNIDGGGYNPYMVFKDKKTADAYATEIDVEFSSTGYDWGWDHPVVNDGESADV